MFNLNIFIEIALLTFASRFFCLFIKTIKCMSFCHSVPLYRHICVFSCIHVGSLSSDDVILPPSISFFLCISSCNDIVRCSRFNPIFFFLFLFKSYSYFCTECFQFYHQLIIVSSSSFMFFF